jgi:hypothetical protein
MAREGWDCGEYPTALMGREPINKNSAKTGRFHLVAPLMGLKTGEVANRREEKRRSDFCG